MSSDGTSATCNYYNEFDNTFIPIDMYTAASLGDLYYFEKYGRSLAAKISIPNQAGWTPLMYACARGHSQVVNYLLTLGASRNSKSNSGVTPLMLAVCSADVSIVDSVFDFSNLEERDYRKWTPLFYAVHFAREKCLTYLLSRGADVNIVDFENETPVMKAIKQGTERMVELLLKTTRNLDVISYKQESAVMLANQSNNPKIYTLVKRHYDYLKTCERTAIQNCDINNKTPINCARNSANTPVQHCSPTPIKQQIANTPVQHCSPTPIKQQIANIPVQHCSPTPITQQIANTPVQHCSPTPIKQQIVNTPVQHCSPTPIKQQIASIPVQHCSPTPIKQQIKMQYFQMKTTKTLTYSPNNSPRPNLVQTPKQKGDWDPFKSIMKKFWSPQLRPHNNVETFLKGLGLEKYWPIFRDEEVDFETLMTMNEQNLMELGIELFGPRKKIYLGIQQMKYHY